MLIETTKILVAPINLIPCKIKVLYENSETLSSAPWVGDMICTFLLYEKDLFPISYPHHQTKSLVMLRPALPSIKDLVYKRA